MADDDNLALGTPVRFKRPLHRVRTLANREQKVWEADPYRAGEYAGIVVGVRTLSDGEVIAWGAGYRPERHYRAVLIAEDLHRKPVLVLPEDVEVVQ
jgi:hypothetical protein